MTGVHAGILACGGGVVVMCDLCATVRQRQHTQYTIYTQYTHSIHTIHTHRSPTASSTPSETSIQTSSKPPINARALWQRARRAANKAVALRLLRAQHFKTMGEIFEVGVF